MRSTRIRRAHTGDELRRRLQRLHTQTPSCRKPSIFLVCIRPSRLVPRGSHQSTYHRYTDEEKVSGAPDTCSRRLTDGEPAKVKLGHAVGKWGNPAQASPMARKGRGSRPAEAVGAETQLATRDRGQLVAPED
ncbi:hypothetical protein DFH08DRAFT_970101 [Mycena albidolilacea]|uniref:Uncharacterized protein n=1 Tax=Mycena albidolilacea TaxID=1033008 RepID=A0AAD7EFU2_9AGAR|nr:hypothetical protein DFH08DRAFT_970101 [Mycena albidolilacea]